MSEGTPAAGAKRSSSFVSAFIPGLVVGLVVGALAGAYFSTWVSESPGEVPMPSSKRGPTALPEREIRTAPGTPEAPKTDEDGKKAVTEPGAAAPAPAPGSAPASGGGGAPAASPK